MGGKFVVKAGQHQFKSGEKVVSPVTVLPTAPNNYSHKVNYQFEYTDEDGKKLDTPERINKQVFVVEDDTQKLLAKRNLAHPVEDTTLRFHTAEAKPFTAFLFNSESITMDKPNDPFFDEEEIDDELSPDSDSFQTNEDE